MTLNRLNAEAIGYAQAIETYKLLTQLNLSTEWVHFSQMYRLAELLKVHGGIEL